MFPLEDEINEALDSYGDGSNGREDHPEPDCDDILGALEWMEELPE